MSRVHEWWISIDDLHGSMVVCTVRDCKETMGFEEANRRLNAVERLSAERAKRASVFVGVSSKIDYADLSEELWAYAAALEGKDD